LSDEAQPPSRSLLSTQERIGHGISEPLASTDGAELAQAPTSSPAADAWRRFRRNRAALGSLAVLAAVVLIAIFAPLMHTTSPLAQNYLQLDAPPSHAHWMGTDGVGRDQYSRLLFGLRVPLVVAAVGTLITVVLGALIGVVAGFAGGPVDSLLSRFTDIIFAFPSFTLALIVVSLYGPALDPYFGGGGRVILLSMVFALVSWPALMRFVRALALGLKEQPFVEAARVSGATNWQIIQRHLVPNMVGLILVQASFIAINVISIETVLSVFGLGVQPPNPDLGQMLFDGVSRLDYSPWEVVFPSIALTVIILALTFVGDGMRDAIDTRLGR
jgi:ABC-type dipeptide/oligopeptide/nickel transport system permease subunit